MIVKKSLVTISIAGVLSACVATKSGNGNKEQQITVTNTSATALTDKPVVIKRSRFKNLPAGTLYPLLLSATNDTVAAQLDDLDGDNKWDELFFVANVLPNATNTYQLNWVATQPQFEKRTSVRFGKRASATTPVEPATSETLYQKELPKSLGFQRYQTDGPSWENDKVGFRHYLDGRNAKDVFGKLVPYMSPENVGINSKGEVEDNYHVMEKWGRDILAVGNSIGIGGVALVYGNQLLRLGVTVDDSVNNVEKTTFNIITEGPARSILQFNYSNWQPPNNNQYKAEETVSIWPGMYAYHNAVKVTGLKGNEHIGIGMVNLNSTKAPAEVKVNNKVVALILYDKHTYNKEWWLGLALILPADKYMGYVEAPRTGKLSNTFLVKLKVNNNEAVGYYAVAGWEMSNSAFKNAAGFEKYVQHLAEQISAEVVVEVH